MTVTEMIATLQKLSEEGYADALVLKASDDEGNSFSRLSSFSPSVAVIDKRGVELIHPDDLEWYDTAETTEVVCAW